MNIEIATLLAIILGPLIAVQITELLRRRQELRDRRDRTFQALMSTRSARLAPAHVEALNLVEILFHSQKPQDRRVCDQLRLYLAHLNDRQYPQGSWGARATDLLTDLLYEMGRSLGYSFDKSQIRNSAYYPAGYENIEMDQAETRRLLIKLLKNEIHLSVKSDS